MLALKRFYNLAPGMVLSADDGYIKILQVPLNKMLTILFLLLLQTHFSRVRRALSQ